MAAFEYGVLGASSLTVNGNPITFPNPVTDNSVLYKIGSTVLGCPLSTSELLGRGTSGDVDNITLGAGLGMTGNTLVATGASTNSAFLWTTLGQGTPVYNRVSIGATGTRQVMYTAPANTKAVFMGYHMRNQTANSGVALIEQYDGTDYWVLSRQAVSGNEVTTTGTDITTGSVIMSVLEPTHQLVFNNTSAATCSHIIYPSIIEFPSTVNVKSRFVNMPAAATNYTIYTCPSSTTAYFLGVGMNPGDSNNVYFCNNSGSSRTIDLYVVPPAGSPGISNQVQDDASVATDRTIPLTCPRTITAGVTIQAALNNTGPYTGWVNVMEFV